MTANKEVTGIAIALILIATLGVTGIQMLGNANFVSGNFTDTINSTTPPATIYLSQQGIKSGSETVRNTTLKFISTNNYSINYDTGVLTTTAKTNLTNNSIFYVDYVKDNVNTTTKTLVTVVFSAVGAIALIIIMVSKFKK